MQIVLCETTEALGSSSLISSKQEGPGSFLELFSDLVKGLLQAMESPLSEARPGGANGSEKEKVFAWVFGEPIVSQGLIQKQALDSSLETRPPADTSPKGRCHKLSDQEHLRPSEEKYSFAALANLLGAKSEKPGVSDCELHDFGGCEVLGSVYPCQGQMLSQDLLLHASDERTEIGFAGSLQGPNGEEIAWSMRGAARAFPENLAEPSDFSQMFEPKAKLEAQLNSSVPKGEVKTKIAGEKVQAQPPLFSQVLSPGLSPEGLSEPISMSQPLVAQGLKDTWQKVSMAVQEALGEKELHAPGEKVILETQGRGLRTSLGHKAAFTGLAEVTQGQKQRWEESSGDTKHGSWVASCGPKAQEQMADTSYEPQEAIDTMVSGFNRRQEGLEQALLGGQPESRHESFKFLQQTKANSLAGKPSDGSGLSQASPITQYPDGTQGESVIEPSRPRLSGNVQGAGQADTIKAEIHKANILDQQVVHMELEPPELGLLRVRIKVHRDGVEALFLTQGPEQKAALEQGLSQLRQSLAEQGFINQHLAVDVGDGRGNWTFQNRMQGAPLLGHNPDSISEPRQEHTNSSPAQEEPGILHLRV